MYCSNCGRELKENEKFCINCGKKAKSEGKESLNDARVNDTHKKLRINIKKKNVVIILLVIIVALISVLLGSYVYKLWSVDNAKEHFEYGAYGESIEEFENAIASGDKNPENYIMLATAYVEKGNLYQARETLKEGYAKTKAEALLDVSIWGPMSAFEHFFFSSMESHNVRQEYRFNGDRVKSYQRVKGIVKYECSYYFNLEGTLTAMDVYNYELDVFGGGDLKDLSPYSTYISEDIDQIEFNYEGEGIVEVAWNGEPYLKLNYENSICKSIVLISDEIECGCNFEYDDKGRIVKSTTLERSNEQQNIVLECEVMYENEGYNISCTHDSIGTGNVKYDNDGRELLGELNYYEYESWSVVWQGEKLISVAYNDRMLYEFEYSKDGFLSVAINNSFLNPETVYVTYDEDGRLGFVDYIKNSGEEIKKTLTYNSTDQLVDIVIEFVYPGEIIFIDYEYAENGKLIEATKREYGNTIRYEFEYDELGRIKNTSCCDVLYIAGTYTGVAEGWSEDIVVEVTVDSLNILSIEVIEHGETYGVGTKAFDPIIERVIGSNSTEVDAISGSTITSESLINAINNALEKAKITEN